MKLKNSTPRHRLLLVAALIIIWTLTGNSTAYADVDSLDHLSKVVVMENGRIKPLDTFAQNILKQVSGRSRFQKKPAIQWLARVLFTPEISYDDKVFLITNQEVLDSIGVQREGKARERYSFSQLQKGLTKLRQLAINASKIDGKQRDITENEIIGLYNKLYVYQQLLASFDFILPHADFNITSPETRTLLQFPADKKTFSFFDIAGKREQLKNFVASLGDKQPEEYGAAENEAVTLSRRLDQWARFYGELPLTLFPSKEIAKDGEKEKWLSPWAIMSPAVTRAQPISENLKLINRFVGAYRGGNQAAFDDAVSAFNSRILEQGGERIRARAISMEVTYNRLDPFYKGKFFYGFAVLFLLLSYLFLPKWFYRGGFLLLILGFLLHLVGVVARMYIMNRPPVTNLYETFIFTGLITALLGIILEWAGKKNIGILTGALAGLVMLMIAGKYAMEGDTMGMLVAVLDSNFWLAFHVITIILGYAGVVLSGFIGHVYIVQKILSPNKTDVLKNTFQAVYAIQAFGIIFTFLGTVLGGIWADQSWGRFWGWDPKENGALLILLWSAILFHAMKSKWIKETGMAFGTVIGVIAVSLAWFGVNLLGVGLHSYGFTSGVAKSLFMFIAFEMLFMLVTGFLLMNNKKTISA